MNNPQLSVSISPAKVGYTKVGLNQKELKLFRTRAMKRACIYISNYVKRNHNYKDRTGRLTRAIHYTILNQAKKGLLYIKESETKVDPKYGNYSYAPYVFNDTGSYSNKRDRYYTIRPRYARALHFFNRNGEEVYTAQVRHPGSPADESLNNAVHATRKQIVNIYKEELKKFVAEGVLVK